MMNYESGDVMKVFPMHDITTDGNTGSATKSSMEIRGKDDIAQIHICIHQSQAELRIRR